jgi:3'-phosphoadenosine 5'-phosphosulfate sulfotransferase (PAPS reductase)/FAD synthetase
MAAARNDYSLSQLDFLEAESIHIIREVAAEFEHPVLLFSGGKDSIVMLALAERAFWPAKIPFPVMHVDTGHNFGEVIEFRDRRVAEVGVQLIVASVQESIDSGRVVEETGRWASRNRLQTTTLLDAIGEHQFDAVFGGARRDEEKARAKERVFSFRDEFGQWDPKNQRPELWGVYNTPFPPMSVTLVLGDDIDISRGDMVCRPHNHPAVTQDVDAMVCWMSETRKLSPRDRLIVKHTTRTAKAIVRDLHYQLDVNTLHRHEGVAGLSLNEIGRVTLRETHSLFCDPYTRNRQTGGIILVDEATGATVAAGMITDAG